MICSLEWMDTRLHSIMKSFPCDHTFHKSTRLLVNIHTFYCLPFASCMWRSRKRGSRCCSTLNLIQTSLFSAEVSKIVADIIWTIITTNTSVSCVLTPTITDSLWKLHADLLHIFHLAFCFYFQFPADTGCRAASCRLPLFKCIISNICLDMLYSCEPVKLQADRNTTLHTF